MRRDGAGYLRRHICMRRRRNVFPFGYAGCLRRPVFFCLGRKGIQPLFLCAAKKKPLAVKRKRQRGISIFPFAIPLKRPRRGLRPPSLDFPRSLVRTEVFLSLQNAKQMRICESGEVIEILCGCFGCILYGSPFMRDILRSPCKEEAYRIPYVKYSTGANKTTRTVYRAIGKPHQTAARRAF